MKSYQQLFAELKRRSVFRVVAVYGATAFVILQVADLLREGLNLPTTFLPFITAFVLLGFPLAIILAWAFELTPEGVRRTESARPGEIEDIIAAPASKRWPAGLLALAGFAALVGSVWFAGQRSGAAAALGGDPAADLSAAPADGRGVRFAYGDLADDGRPSIAVLPFIDLSPQGDQGYFSDGITEEILNVLAKVPELRVTARTSAFAFKGRQVDLRTVGDSLGVGYLVEGSVRKAGDELRITAQLIDARDGSHLWSESYDRQLDNVFQIQTEIAEAIAEALRLPLGIGDPAGLVTPTADLEAYDLYLAARSRMRERGESLREAVELLEGAIARDSSWAPAWAALAEARELRTWYPAAWDAPEGFGQDRTEMFLEKQEEAADAARRALELDPDIASAHVALGSVHRNQHEWERAETEYLRALQLDPDNAEAHQQYSELLVTLGRIAEGRRAAERALALDRVPVRLLQLANALAADDRVHAALDTMETAIALDVERRTIGLYGGWPYLAIETGEYDRMFEFGAVPAFDREPTAEERAAMVAALREKNASGYPEDLLEAAAWMVFDRPDSAAAAMLGEFDSFPYQNWNWIWDAMFDPLRDEPAFRELLKRLDLEDATPRRTPRAAGE